MACKQKTRRRSRVAVLRHWNEKLSAIALTRALPPRKTLAQLWWSTGLTRPYASITVARQCRTYTGFAFVTLLG